MNHSLIHQHNLERLVHNLSSIDEDYTSVEWIMKEGIYLAKYSGTQKKLCDLVIGLYDGTGLCVELKGTPKHRNRAILQLDSGEGLMKNLGYNHIRKKIVYYSDFKLKYEVV